MGPANHTVENSRYEPQCVWGPFEVPREFFSERADQSEVKAQIVSKYFDAWSKIIAPRAMRSDGKLAYIDLFAGPGRYADGSASTPLMVLTKALQSVNVRNGLVSIFNDMDASVESEAYWWRVDHLRRVGARVRFVSLEPLLGPLSTLDFTGIHWAIAGGESGPQARPVEGEWVRDIRDACIEQRVAFHFKQWGGSNKKRTGRVLDDRTWDDLPTSVQVA